MGDLYNRISELCKKRKISGYRMCKDIGIQPSIMTDLKSGRKKGLSAETAQKIADYFGVTVGYLLGSEEENLPSVDKRRITEEDIKLALFGGSGEVTDEMWNEATFAIQLIKERHKRTNQKDE